VPLREIFFEKNEIEKRDLRKMRSDLKNKMKRLHVILEKKICLLAVTDAEL